MGQIHLLENDVIDKIAAGEVVDRPASVVKELVDNALDAGASSISVALREGGASLIAVTDDGSGMDAEDARLAITRHATSKITNTDDLFGVVTRGFRGEALASIASVSKFTLSTKREGAEGVKLVVENGEIQVLPYSGPVGTTIVVEDLFATVPARKKFLKSAAAEWGYCSEVLQQQALSHPEVAFVISHNDKQQFRLPANAKGFHDSQSLRERARGIFGAQKAGPMIAVQHSERIGTVHGLIAPPGHERSNGKMMHMFVNGRPVKDKTMRYGIMRGFHSHLLKGKYPFVILNLQIDPHLVDVNVHPAKIELRFQYASEVQDLLARGIRHAIRQGAWAAPMTHELKPAPAPSEPLDFGVPPPGALPRRSPPAMTASASRGTSTWPSRPAPMSAPVRAGGASQDYGEIGANPTPVATPKQEVIPWSELRFVGDFGHCYLFFASAREDRLLVVDQHAFHERIIFERLCRDEKLLQTKQNLLIPEALELSAADVAALQEKEQDLTARGFSLKFVAETTVEVHAIPDVLSGCRLQDLLEDLADPTGAEESVESNADVARLLLATIACHSAVRAGEDLTEDDRNALLREAADVDFYLNCPHGRRVFRWFDKSQVGRWFDR